EGGKLQLEYVAFDPRAEVEGVADLLALRAQFKGLELSTIVEPGVPSFVFGDPGRVRQVLLNLARIPIKVTREGAVIIRLRARPHALECELSDTGTGDREEMLHGPCSGGPSPSLGSLKQLIEAMGGDVTVSSIEGRGSRCLVLLPIETQVPAERDLLPDAAGR